MSAWRPPMRRNLWTAFTVSAPPKAPIEFWTLEHERARRSRKHHLVQMDEAAFGEPDSSDICTASIAPTLLGLSWPGKLLRVGFSRRGLPRPAAPEPVSTGG